MNKSAQGTMLHPLLLPVRDEKKSSAPIPLAFAPVGCQVTPFGATRSQHPKVTWLLDYPIFLLNQHLLPSILITFLGGPLALRLALIQWVNEWFLSIRLWPIHNSSLRLGAKASVGMLNGYHLCLLLLRGASRSVLVPASNIETLGIDFANHCHSIQQFTKGFSD